MIDKMLIRGAKVHNLKNIDVKFPLGVMTCVTGVSGSGKSSLINEVLYKTLARELNRAKVKHGKCKSIKGIEYFDKIITYIIVQQIKGKNNIFFTVI